jgi:hypothetical protein
MLTCQDKYEKATGRSHLHWKNNGKNGVDDPQHSEHRDNYAKWRSPSGGQMKIKVAECVAKLLNDFQQRETIAQMVYNKIMHIEGQMRSTYDWCGSSKTGIGLKERDALSFNEMASNVLLLCVIIIILASDIPLIHIGQRDLPVLLCS